MTRHWLLETSAALDLQRHMHLPLTAEMVEAFDRAQAVAGAAPRCLTISGPEAAISVTGVLTKRASARMYWCDRGCTYVDIQAGLALAAADPQVKRITLNIDSPGGTVDGLFETLDALRSMTKPVTARCSLAASAAYGIASACKRIEAVGIASMFGSIGVATTYAYWNSETLVELTNTDSPDKRPDARTEEGKAVIRRELDAIAGLFIDAIARGRGVSASKVRTDYGRGAVLLSAAAKRAGMIDSIPSTTQSARKPSSAATHGIAGLLGTPAPGAALAFVNEKLMPMMPRAAAPSTPDLAAQIVALIDGNGARFSRR